MDPTKSVTDTRHADRAKKWDGVWEDDDDKMAKHFVVGEAGQMSHRDTTVDAKEPIGSPR